MKINDDFENEPLFQAFILLVFKGIRQIENEAINFHDKFSRGVISKHIAKSKERADVAFRVSVST